MQKENYNVVEVILRLLTVYDADINKDFILALQKVEADKFNANFKDIFYSGGNYSQLENLPELSKFGISVINAVGKAILEHDEDFFNDRENIAWEILSGELYEK